MVAEIHQLKSKPVTISWMCSACGVDAGCNCGAPMMSKSKRAADAIAANPHKSNVMIAEEIGVGAETVRRARQSTSPHEEVDELRIGRDGKTRRIPVRHADEEQSDEENQEGLRVIAARGFLNRAAEAKEIATLGKLRASDVTEAIIKAADDAAAAWSTAARDLRRMIADG